MRTLVIGVGLVALSQLAALAGYPSGALGPVVHAKGKKARPSPSQPADDADACTPGYDPCIPPGPDVDCAGGSGNGPRYVEGPVRVTGSDPYGLDRDGDGIGCE